MLYGQRDDGEKGVENLSIYDNLANPYLMNRNSSSSAFRSQSFSEWV